MGYVLSVFVCVLFCHTFRIPPISIGWEDVIGCVKGKNKKKNCYVNPVNADSRWHLTKMASKCRERYSDIGGSCKLALAYNTETKELIEL